MKRFLVRFFRLVLTVPVLAAFFACSTGRPQPEMPVNAELDWRHETAATVLARLRDSRQKFTNLSAFFTLSLEPPPQGSFANLSGVLFVGEGNPRPPVRIKALGVFGRLLFDMVQSEKRLEIYVPAQQTLYQGTIDDKMPGESPFGEAFQVMMIDWSAMQIKAGTSLVFNGDEVIVTLTEGELHLDRRTGLIKSWKNGKQVVEYDDYQQEAGFTQPIPAHIEIRAIDNSQHAVCTLRNIARQDNEISFSLAGYNPVHIRELSELPGADGPKR